MRRSMVALVAMMLVVVPACGGDRASEQRDGGTQSGAGSGEPMGLPQGAEKVEMDPDEFTTEIDNPYWPMVPGTRWTYRETEGEDTELSVVVTVTNETKRIANGVTARVVRDTVTEDGRLIEDTFDWYAQDAEGNVWYLGENTAEFEGGEISTRAGSFEAGVDGAQAGVIMPAEPQPGMKYRQEYYKGEAEDNGEVLSTEEMAEVPYGRFDDALMTKDTITIEPDVLEYKLYARDVGPVLVLGVSGGPQAREELIDLDNADERWTERAGTAPLGRGPLLENP